VRFAELPSPVGPLLLVGDGERLTGLYLENHRGAPAVGAGWRRDRAAFAVARDQLEQYFAGELERFALPLAARGTSFQQRVWNALTELPFGSTTTYGRLATALGQPSAARAIGMANARNPISIAVPCHRVVGAAGRLTGYGGGIERKRALLAHEATVLRQRGG
jgi:methylated-DNA-[protein]-cysteine S-methyltransferase